MDPVLGMSALGAGEGLLNWILGSEERKQQKEDYAQKQWLTNFLKGKLNEGPVFDQAMMDSMIGNRRTAMQPTYNKIAAGAGRFSGMRSPETWKMIGEQTIPLDANFLEELIMKNATMTANRNQNNLGLLTSVIGR